MKREMKGKPAILSVTYVLLLCIVVGNLWLFLNADTMSLDLSYWDSELVPELIKWILKNWLPSILFVLFVLVFRKNAAGIVLLPIIYLVVAVLNLIKTYHSFTGLIEKIVDPDLFGPVRAEGILYVFIELVAIAACVVMIVLTVSGKHNRALLITASVALIAVAVINVIMSLLNSDFSFWSGDNELSKSAVILTWMYNRASDFKDILLYTGLFYYCLFNPSPSLSAAFRQSSADKKNKKILNERRMYEEDLEELESRLENGLITQEQYDEVSADIREKISQLQPV